MLDLDFVRAQFPALDTPWALLDNAGGSVPPRQVIDRVSGYMSRHQVQLGASYAQSAEAAALVIEGRYAAGRLVNADPDQIVLGASSTALTQLLARALGALWEPGDEVIVTNLDHETNIGPWRALEEAGLVIKEWTLHPDTAALEVADLKPLLSSRTRLVAFTACSNIAGSLMDTRGIIDRIHAAGALAFVDGVAYAPHRRVDVRELDADFFVCSLYKVFGPHQSLLFGKRDVLRSARSQNHFFYGPDEVPGKLEPGGVCHELVASLPGILEYLDAVDRHHHGDDGTGPGTRLARVFDLFAEHEESLAGPLLDYLAGRTDVRVIGSPVPDRARRVSTVSFVVQSVDSATIPIQLDERQVAVRFGHFYAYRAIRDLGLMDCSGVVRASLLHYNTPEEVERLVNGLEEVLPR